MSTEGTPEKLSDRMGRLGFAYCKIATWSLLAGRFALPTAALLSAAFFTVGYIRGKHDTKCYLRYPLLAAGFWVFILGVWLCCEFRFLSVPWIHPG